ncbi:phospholipase DDHD2 [Centruroides vittatus]|uniref:phospholipase DDHD2 n=1 Tax=Centruroides vittatus TaxID=120091 RepID=UPI00350F4357
MATKHKDDSKHHASSLLLQPPRSGFSWDPMNNSAILMPIGQKEELLSEDGAEIDSFVNQSYNTTSSITSSKSDISLQQPTLNSPQQKESYIVEPPLFPNAPSAQMNFPLNSANQPPPDYNMPPPVVSTTEVQYAATSTYFSNIPVQATQPSIPSSISFDNIPSSPPTGPPVGGPLQDFRRKGPAVYAPPPNFNAPPQQTIFQPPIPHENSQPIQMSPPSFQPSPSNFATGQEIPISTSSSAHQFSSVFELNQPGNIFYQNYKPIQPHWFYMRVIEKREIWLPFSMLDSVSLEEAHKLDPNNAVVATDGGRYDVFIGERLRKAVYWNESPTIVRRCTWFYRTEGQNRFVPYEEDFSNKLEEHFKSAVVNNLWHKRIEFSGSETIVIDNPNVIWHFLPCSHTDEWGNVLENQVRPRIVKRGISDFVIIEDGESSKIDHLVFVVHGVGAVCDMRFRTVIECVDDIRSMAFSLMENHFKPHIADGRIGRVEFLPVSWHSMLHSEATGIDRRLRYITLSSIPKLRHFINDTILDIPFYCSPVYCQTIISAVGSELNRLYDLFKSRNPRFSGNISMVGHSLGSLILFDILAHQIDPKDSNSSSLEDNLSQTSNEENLSLEKSKNEETALTLEHLFENLGLHEYLSKFQEEKIDLETLKMCSEEDIKELSLPKGPRLKLMSMLKQLNEQQGTVQLGGKTSTDSTETEVISEKKDMKSHADFMDYGMGIAGAGPRVNFPKLKFEPSIFFALGSPISMFLTVRGLEKIGEDYRLPTCPFFYNIFHPFDPVAYRIEPLIDPSFNLKPVLVPHHKGRKRMHLEIRESLSRMGADLKQKLLDPLWNTWNSINEFARAHRFGYQPEDPSITGSQESTVGLDMQSNPQEFDDSESTVSTDFNVDDDVQIGQLNAGKRIDYVLQEKPIESLNEYLFALGSHACYWESEDTVLMVIKKIYALMNVFPITRGPRLQHNIPLYNPALSSQSRFTDISPSGLSLSSSAGQLPQVGISPTQSSLDTPQSTVASPVVNPSQSQTIGPPPLSGFVKASPLVRK